MDHERQVIVAARATDLTSDKQQAVAMVAEAIANTGAIPKEVSADAGYYSAKVIDDLHALGVDPFVAPEQTRHGRVLPPAPPRTHSKASVRSGPDATQVADQAWSPTLRVTHGDRGTGLRPDQAGPRVPAVSAAGFG